MGHLKAFAPCRAGILGTDVSQTPPLPVNIAHGIASLAHIPDIAGVVPMWVQSCSSMV
jgi:hypothetical protein